MTPSRSPHGGVCRVLQGLLGGLDPQGVTMLNIRQDRVMVWDGEHIVWIWIAAPTTKNGLRGVAEAVSVGQGIKAAASMPPASCSHVGRLRIEGADAGAFAGIGHADIVAPA